MQTGGRSKSGLGFTPLQRNPFPSLYGMKPDDTVSEMRVTDKFRVFGIRRRSVYFVIHLDPDHKVLPS